MKPIREITRTRLLEMLSPVDKSLGLPLSVFQAIDASISEFCIFDARTYRFIYTNQRVQRNTGYSPDDLLMLGPFDLLRNLMRKDFIVQLELLRRGKLSHLTFETQRYRRDGTVYPVEVWIHYAPRFSPLSERSVFISNAIDITQRKEAEDSLKASVKQLEMEKKRLRTVINALPVGVAILSRSGQVVANESLGKLWGSRLLKRSVSDRTKFTARDSSSGRVMGAKDWPILQAFHSGRPVKPREIDIVALNGVRRTILNWAVPISNEAGEVEEAVSVSLDVTREKRRKADLEERVRRRTADLSETNASLRRANHQLKESRERIRKLSCRMQTLQEDERAWIAREVHDELGQTLTALKFNLCRMKAGPGEKDSALELLKRAFQSVRRISTGVHPPKLREQGLIPAVEWLVSDFQVCTGIECRLEILVRRRKFPDALSIGVYRILQESLTNIARHAGASRIEISISSQARILSLIVHDNGQGIRASRKKKKSANGLGLCGIRERAAALGGRFSILSSRTGGTRVRVTFPFPGIQSRKQR